MTKVKLSANKQDYPAQFGGYQLSDFTFKYNELLLNARHCEPQAKQSSGLKQGRWLLRRFASRNDESQPADL